VSDKDAKATIIAAVVWSLLLSAGSLLVPFVSSAQSCWSSSAHPTRHCTSETQLTFVAAEGPRGLIIIGTVVGASVVASILLLIARTHKLPWARNLALILTGLIALFGFVGFLTILLGLYILPVAALLFCACIPPAQTSTPKLDRS
jgi:hypothetical protein